MTDEFDEALSILYAKPNFRACHNDDLPLFVRREKYYYDALSKLDFEPNKVARSVFEQDTLLDAMRWRLQHQRINNRLITGETGEGKTSAALQLAMLFTNWKQRNIHKARKIQFTIEHNFLLGQFVSLKTQIIYQHFIPYEEIVVDELELCINVMRSTSRQNVYAKNMLDSGRYRYNPLSGICPSLASIDKGISSTRMQWNLIAEYNNHNKRVVELIVKYNVHSRDNIQYKWVKFCEMELEWCDTAIYNQAHALKESIVATKEGMKTHQEYEREVKASIKNEEEQEQVIQANEILALFNEEKISRAECAFRLKNDAKQSINAIQNKLKASFNTVKKLIREYEATFEQGKLDKTQAREVIN